MPIRGATFGIVGALAAFPRRLAAREVARLNGVLRRGVTRKTTHVVFGRTLLERSTAAEIVARYDAVMATGQRALSEAGFLRLLELASGPLASAISAQALREQSRLSERDLALLSLFDAFEHDGEPYSFRDVILARKYAGLIAGGASWHAIARSAHRTGEVTSLTALSLHVEGSETIYARSGDLLHELDGQTLLPLGDSDDAELEELFGAAEIAEAEHEFALASALYRRCLSIDPSDSVAAFNLANVLKAEGKIDEASHAYAIAIKQDPDFVEAWFNFADLLRGQDRSDAARKHLLKAVAIDSDYADAVYNLGALEYDLGNLAAARRWWVRYLELDGSSEWARIAARGIQFVDLHKTKSAG